MTKYQQIYADLVADIENGRLDRGDRVPSETELMEMYEASRGTVRRAVDQLQDRGFVQKMHGKGVFVTKPAHIEFRLGGIVSFKEVYERLGREVVTTVAEFRRMAADRDQARLLGVPERTRIVRIKRVRRIDGENVILDVNLFVDARVPGLTEAIAADSIYHYIEKDLGLTISYAHRVIEAQPVGADDQKHIDLNGMDHVIVVKNHTHFYDGRQFEYTESRHRLDKFYFSDVARR